MTNLEAFLDDLQKTSLGRREFLAAIPLLMAACSSATKNQASANEDLSVNEEKLMARQSLPQIRRDYPALQNAEIQNYVSSLGDRLVSSVKSQAPYEYSFTVVDVPMVNAFALPAGPVFVTLPLLKTVQSEAELAGILGHEIGHVQARHTSLRIHAQQKVKAESWWYGGSGAALGAAAGLGASSIACPPGTGNCAESLVTMLAGLGAGAGLLIQKYKYLANTQENELEADRLGFQISQRAGFEVTHIGDFYSRLQKLEEQKLTRKNISLLDAMKTHPPSKERVSQLRSLTEQAPKNPAAIVSSKEFEKMQNIAAQLRI